MAERASVAGVIAALAACPGRGPSVARVAGQAVEFICKYYKARNLCYYICGALWPVTCKQWWSSSASTTRQGQLISLCCVCGQASANQEGKHRQATGGGA